MDRGAHQEYTLRFQDAGSAGTPPQPPGPNLPPQPKATLRFLEGQQGYTEVKGSYVHVAADKQAGREAGEARLCVLMGVADGCVPGGTLTALV